MANVYVVFEAGDGGHFLSVHSTRAGADYEVERLKDERSQFYIRNNKPIPDWMKNNYYAEPKLLKK